MAHSYPTMLDIAKANGSDALVGLVDETLTAHPELRLGAARTIKGQQYKTLVRVQNPTVAFRNANEGAEASKGVYQNRLVETYILDAQWASDKAVADAAEDGAEAFIAMEAGGVMEASELTLCKQFYYGTANDAKGFQGLQSYVDAAMLVDATGQAANTGSSVYAVKFGPKYVQWVWGVNGMMKWADVIEQYITDAAGKRYLAYLGGVLAYPGVQCLHRYCVGRIKNLTAEAGKGLTDALLGSLMSKFPVGMEPDVLLCTKRSLEQLRASRTATNATGKEAPTPTDFEGVPIMPTEALGNTEAIA